MRSFFLAAAALATSAGAAPIGASENVAASISYPGNVPSVPSFGEVGLVEGEVKSVADAVHARNVVSEITDAVDSIKSKVSDLHLRSGTPSVAIIFDNIVTDIQPYTEQLTYLVPSNYTVTEITNLVASIKAPLVAAIPQLKALVGQNASVIFAPVNENTGDAELTVSEIAAIVGGDVKLILAALGQVINVAKAEGGDILSDVEDILADLGTTVTEILSVVGNLVDGLATSLAPVLAPVVSIVAELGSSSLASSLGLTL